ncbi:MAG: serine/threonine protein kinase with repeat [Deltaproteobacteria bacterium]|nr:serine/threonine protein kinase with repeat [Deltaproteobacteria bacterium]
MAEVQLAIQRGPAGFEKLVVVKLVHANLASQKNFVDMLLDEARIAALVKHPNVVDIYDLGEANGRYFIAMEYLEGEPLLAVLRAGRDGKRLDPLSTARLVADTAEGLDAAHELRSMGGEPIELVHHDVSLGNIVVLYNGQAKLVDFGVAKATMSVATPTRVQGKFGYMAPEKLRGNPGDRRSDIWSLGCVLWEALTLRRLFKGSNDHDTMRQVLGSAIVPPSSINSEVQAAFDPIVMRALDRDPANRYATAKEMAKDLEEVLRQHGYGGRNDQIAKYMQATFDDHIVARKKLLQEVSSKGRASSAVLAAAFQDSLAGVALTTSSEFSARFKRITSELTAEGTPQRQGSAPGPQVAYPRASAEEVATFQTVSPAIPVADPTPEPTPEPPTSLEPTPARRMRPQVIVAIVVVAVAIVVAVVASRGQDTANPATIATGSPASGMGSPESAFAGSGTSVSAVGSSATTGSEDRGSEDAIEMLPHTGDSGSSSSDSGSGSPRPRLAPKVEKPSAEVLYRAGFQAFVHGDTKAALASFNRAQQANPSFAPAWRGLGMVQERIGDKAAAKSAFARYLQLAPAAADADQIRARAGRL